MHENPLVSILIPVYNREKTIIRALNAALSQTYKNIEIICVDNCSADNTFNILLDYSKRDSRIKAYLQKENVGPVRNWVSCLEYSNGDLIKFLWSDDSIQPTAIEEMVKPFVEDNIGFVYSSVDIIFEQADSILNNQYCFGKTGKYKTSDFVAASAFLLPKKNVPVSPGCALFRRETIIDYLKVNFENGKGLDFSKYGAGNDLFLFYGACKDYESFYFIKKPLCVFYGGKDSFSMTHNLKDYYDFIRDYFILFEYGNIRMKQNYCTIMNLFYKKDYEIKKYNYLFFVFWMFKKSVNKIKQISKHMQIGKG